MFQTEFVGMFIVYFHTKFHIPSSIISLVITIQLKAEYISTVVLHFTNYLNIICIFLSNIYHSSEFQDPTVSGTSFASTSEVCTTFMMVLLLVTN